MFPFFENNLGPFTSVINIAPATVERVPITFPWPRIDLKFTFSSLKIQDIRKVMVGRLLYKSAGNVVVEYFIARKYKFWLITSLSKPSNNILMKIDSIILSLIPLSRKATKGIMTMVAMAWEMRPKMTLSIFIKIFLLGLLEPVIGQNLSHKNIEIQKKARNLVDTWKKRVKDEMDAKSGSSHVVPWSARPRIFEASHSGSKHCASPEVAMKSSVTNLSA
ncbi:hypothetical protein V6N11_000598 [Hibiscus sabdariffa]|uniref:TFIIS N-terminal domain-containing protein n=1 Tax=Hibiscus sabdariffa TaxID=183260 RepID=A0ABR2N7J4_9ROSI